MIYFDVTQTGAARHHSGLNRVNVRLRAEAGSAFAAVSWPGWSRDVKPDDWFLTTELFSESERPGLTEWLRRRPCRLAAVFHDAIPLRHPDITWPQSVARHPEYMGLLAGFDRVFAVSETSRQDLLSFWRWQERPSRAEVSLLSLGADGLGGDRRTEPPDPRGPLFLAVGILEPRKNQTFLLDLAEELWSERVVFTLHLAGRVNPRFGRPLLARIRQLQTRYPGLLVHHRSATDEALTRLYRQARATLFATRAEGCGLPVLESLWQGVPCLCSDLPVLRESAEGGGCLLLPLEQPERWKEALRTLARDEAAWRRLADSAIVRPLPRWSEAAGALVRACC